jgi:GT2 family glycosyltransferase
LAILSVITVTHNRRELLLKKAASLGKQTLAPEQFEWVVCINHDVDGSKAALEALALPFGVKLLEFSSLQGSSLARNACVRLAAGELLYFSDDDVLVPEATLEHHLQFHQKQNRPVLGQGDIDWEYQGEVEAMKFTKVHYWNINGVNTSLPRQSFEAVGGFPEWLSSYGHEDVILGYRLYRHGLPLCHVPNATVRHLGANPMRGLEPGKARSAGRNAVIVTRHYPELAFRLGVHPLLMAVKRVSFSPACARLLKRLSPEWLVYEQAYFEGAKEEQERG